MEVGYYTLNDKSVKFYERNSHLINEIWINFWYTHNAIENVFWYFSGDTKLEWYLVLVHPFSYNYANRWGHFFSVQFNGEIKTWGVAWETEIYIDAKCQFNLNDVKSASLIATQHTAKEGEKKISESIINLFNVTWYNSKMIC